MTPEEQRGREIGKRSAVGCLWFIIEALILAVVIKLGERGDDGAAFAIGIFLILLCYFEGRLRK